MLNSEAKCATTHNSIRTVMAGDTLPLMRHRMYDHSNSQIRIARFNRLNVSLDLELGNKIRFPHLGRAS